VRPARPDQIEAAARQSRVFASPCKFGYNLGSVARNRLLRERVTVGSSRIRGALDGTEIQIAIP
jgi:hypothetical protein